MGYTVLSSTHANTISTMGRVLAKARNSMSEHLASSLATGPRILSVEAQEAMLAKVREVRVPNDIDQLELTIKDNAFGPGVVISELGPGNAVQAGLCVGDVITEVNGVHLTNHEQAMQTICSSTCRDLVFSLQGKARSVVIDKTLPGKLQVTLTKRKKGPGVSVESLGLMGLVAAAGLRAGDNILAVNGRLVYDHAETIACMDSTERFLELVVEQTDVDEWGDGFDINI